MLLRAGIDEFEFLRRTDATIKYGIRHRDWRRKGYTYDGPIDDSLAILPESRKTDSSMLSSFCIASGPPVSEAHLFSKLMERSRAPFATKGVGKPLPAAPFHHSYHFDQSLSGKFLREEATGITHVDAVVEAAEGRRNGLDFQPRTCRRPKPARGVCMNPGFL